MLLRRLSEDLKSQSWVAVCLDLSIVILGIFLGLQVAQWYEGRQEIALEASIMERLQAEFEQASKRASDAIQTHQDEIAALEVVSQALRAGKLNPDDEEMFRSALQNAMNYDLGPSRSGTYIEILSSGQLRLIRDQDLRTALIDFDDKVWKAESLLAGFQQNQRKHEAIINQYLTFGSAREQAFDGAPTGVLYLHAEITDFDFEQMADDDEYLQSVRKLIEYHTNFQFWHNQIFGSAENVLRVLGEPRPE